MPHAFPVLTVSCEYDAVPHAVRLLQPFSEMVHRKDFHAPTLDQPGLLAIMLDMSEIPADRVQAQIDIIASALEYAGCKRVRTSTASLRAVREDT